MSDLDGKPGEIHEQKTDENRHLEHVDGDQQEKVQVSLDAIPQRLENGPESRRKGHSPHIEILERDGRCEDCEVPPEEIDGRLRLSQRSADEASM